MFKSLIPVHDTATHNPATATLPSLQETVAESGNLRYWAITNENMWAGQHRVLDEISEIIWSFFHLFSLDALTDFATGNGVDAELCVWELARSFRRRIVLPEVPAEDAQRASTLSRRAGFPTLRESLLFRPWVFYTPKQPDREYVELMNDEDPPHEFFDEDNVRYPFPDHLFWKVGDEGEWEGEGVPIWRAVGKNAKAGEGVRRKRLTKEEMEVTGKELDLVLSAGVVGSLVGMNDQSMDEHEEEEESSMEEESSTDEEEDGDEDEDEDEEGSSMDED